MRPLHVLQVCADRGIAPGGTKGAAQHLRGIASGLLELGHRVTTCAARRADGPFPVPVLPLDSMSVLVDDAGSGGIDVVYERYSLGHTAGLALARRLGVPFVLEVNAPLVDEARTHRGAQLGDLVAASAAEAELLASADLVIVVSSDLAAWVAARRGGPTLVLRNGFAPEWFTQPAGDDGAITHDLVFLGHPKPWHGAERLVTTLAGLAERGHDARLLVIGGGPGADDVVAAAAMAGLADRVDVTGALAPDRASALLATCRIGLAPYPPQSPFYFCPLKIVDYLAAGLPVVSTDQGDVAALVGDAGVVVDARDDVAFIDAVSGVLADRTRARELGRRGRRRAFATMTWTHVAARTVDAVAPLVGVGVR